MGPPITIASTPVPTVCFSDDVLRALEASSAEAIAFCPDFLALPVGAPVILPSFVSIFSAPSVSSACSCFQRTAGATATSAPTPLPTLCFEDDALRALERFSPEAVLFCPNFLALPSGVSTVLPSFVSSFAPTSISSACSCFQRTVGGTTASPTPPPSPLPTECFADNALRALERFSVEALAFCPLYLADPLGLVPLPTFVTEFSAPTITSACSCFQKTAVAPVTTSTPPPSALPTECFADNALRALERFSVEALVFCPAYLVDTLGLVPLPTFVTEFSAPSITSACSCFQKTAVVLATTVTPTPTPLPTECFADNALRALERFSVEALVFCPAYLVDTLGVVPLPTFVTEFSAPTITSACSCFQKTAVVPATTTPTPSPLPTECFADNALRALERFNIEALVFCPAYLADTLGLVPLPTFVTEFSAPTITSACSCFQKTAVAPVTTSSPSPLPTICFADNALRALERFSVEALVFCPAYLADTLGLVPLPSFVTEFSGPSITSACSCFQQTAVAPITTTTPASPPTPLPTECFADNVLRALERFSVEAIAFCPAFLAAPAVVPLPSYVVEFAAPSVLSACSCFQQTVGVIPSTTSPSTTAPATPFLPCALQTMC